MKKRKWTSYFKRLRHTASYLWERFRSQNASYFRTSKPLSLFLLLFLRSQDQGSPYQQWEVPSHFHCFKKGAEFHCATYSHGNFTGRKRKRCFKNQRFSWFECHHLVCICMSGKREKSFVSSAHTAKYFGLCLNNCSIMQTSLKESL